MGEGEMRVRMILRLGWNQGKGEIEVGGTISVK